MTRAGRYCRGFCIPYFSLPESSLMLECCQTNASQRSSCVATQQSSRRALEFNLSNCTIGKLSKPARRNTSQLPLVDGPRETHSTMQPERIRIWNSQSAHSTSGLVPAEAAHHFCFVTAIGSMPVFVMTRAAAGDARNLMNAFAASASLALVATPAENTVYF